MFNIAYALTNQHRIDFLNHMFQTKNFQNSNSHFSTLVWGCHASEAKNKSTVQCNLKY